LSDAPEPLTPADCDCTDLDGFMLNVERLMASELVAVSSLEVVGAALLLWSRAWKQMPAASLPNDERVIAAFCKMPLPRFRKLRAEVLRGFVLCSDGRLYHRFLSAEAMRAFERKQAYRKRRETDSERLKKWREKRDRNDSETVDETRFVREGQGRYDTGQGQVLDTPSPEPAREADDDIGNDWPEDQDGRPILARPPSDHRSRGQRTPGDVLTNLLPKTGPPEKRLKRQDNADRDMANWLTTRGGMNGERAWALLIAARDEGDSAHTEAARELEKISREHRLGWFAEETA
jgi:hypothetical protein